MKVVAFAGDAGGARAVEPVARRLRERDPGAVECRAYAAATQLWTQGGLRPSPPSLHLDGVGCLLLGTSVGVEQWEVLAIQAARERKIRTVSVLDFWSNYRERFTTLAGELVLPDAIAVMDARAESEMRLLGFPPGLLHITGHPGFDDLARLRRLPTGERSPAGPASGLRLLYVSQPLSQLYTPEELGFHERVVLDMVVAALDRVLTRRGQAACLSVRPHPRELGGELHLPVPRSGRLSVRLADPEISPRTAAAASDVVIGMNSMLLMEACLLGKPVVSFQPGLRLPDPLPSNALGWSRAVYDTAELEEALDAELFDSATKALRQQVLREVELAPGATERVMALLDTGS